MSVGLRPASGSATGQRLAEAPHALPPEEVARRLATDLERGLTEEAARARLLRYGPNRLERARRPAYAAIALRQLTDVLVALLIAAAVVSALIGDEIEAATIAAIVVLNALLAFTQEVRAERAVLALRESLTVVAEVVRDGRERSIVAEELVPGDLIVVREGQRVPADARLVDVRGLAVDESILTGESVPVDKSVSPVPATAPLAERSSMAFAGTTVTRGRGLAIVTATGRATEVGTIAGLVAEAEPPPTPLQRQVRTMAKVMAGLGIGITLALGGAVLAQGERVEEAFLVGVSVAVAAVPEGLAATVTIALALGAREMARRGAIVRGLNAVETLGGVTVVVSDKTGTLTENRLRLVATRTAAGRTERELLTAATLASSVSAVGDGKERRIVGDPVDVAIARAAQDRGIDPADLLRERRLAEERPFDPVRKRMTLVYEEDGALHAYTKGAPEVVLAQSSGDPRERERLLKAAETWAAQGLRVLAVAEGPVPARGDEGEWEQRVRPVGLVALEDPLRESARFAVAEARAGGIRVEVLTGDHPATARAIGRALELPEEAVHARVTPAEKLRFVEELQRAGEVVAVTGDGVNDAPALRRADVGIAMGKSGTETAREAADVVLTDDNFATIVAAIREGRRIASNIRKFVAFLLSANLGEVALFAVAIPAGLGAPMTVVQVLTINLLTDGPPAVALARDPPSPAIMRQPPQRDTRLFPVAVWGSLGAIGLLVGLAALAAFLLGRSGGDDQARTMAFATIALAELALVFCLRSPVNPAWEAPRNPYLAASVAVSALLIGAAIYVPPLNAPLGTVPLDLAEVGAVALLALAPAALVEAGKAGSRRRSRSSRG